MRLLSAVTRIPGGLMVVPLLAGALLNTIDQRHFAPVQWVLAKLGAPPIPQPGGGAPVYEFLRLGGFSQLLLKDSAGVLIALFLLIVGSQMDLRLGARALKKGVVLTASKFALGIGLGWLLGWATDPWNGLLGLSCVAIIAGLTNENGGMYAALSSQLGRRSDTGALAILSINDGPFLTMVALGLLGESFPVVAFISVLLPITLGMLLGNLDPAIRALCAPGERLLIPFFAFSLGAGMDIAHFGDLRLLAGGLALGVATAVAVPLVGVVALRLVGERRTIAAWCGGSVAGNAVATPKAIAIAAATVPDVPPERIAALEGLVPAAQAQLSIAVLTTAALCPLLAAWWARREARLHPEPAEEDPEVVRLEEAG